MPNVNNQIWNINKVKLLLERYSGDPPVIFKMVSTQKGPISSAMTSIANSFWNCPWNTLGQGFITKFLLASNMKASPPAGNQFVIPFYGKLHVGHTWKGRRESNIKFITSLLHLHLLLIRMFLPIYKTTPELMNIQGESTFWKTNIRENLLI